MEMNSKKGMYFTLMTIIFLFIFLFVFSIPGYKRLGEKMLVTEMRVDSMNDFIKDIQRDTERGLYISSYRALMALEQYIITTGNFLNNTNQTFMEALLNGTVHNVSSSLMVASTFPNWIENIQTKALKFNIIVNITVHNVSIYQDDPWNVKVNSTITLFVRDSTGIASWVRNETIETSILIGQFEDPLYIMNARGRTTQIITQTPFDGNFTFERDGEWNASNLLAHIDGAYYASNPDAPSFLMRFENNSESSSCCGIESMLDLKKLEEVGFQPSEINTESSIIDYYYWNAEENAEYMVNISGTPTWVKIDSGHIAKYMVEHPRSCEIGVQC